MKRLDKTLAATQKRSGTGLEQLTGESLRILEALMSTISPKKLRTLMETMYPKSNITEVALDIHRIAKRRVK